MKSFMASPSTIERKWYVVDATGHTLGRLSSEIASILRGKNKPTFTPHIDTGDYVIVVNADKIIDESDDTRTHKIFHALDEICYEFDLSKPLWLDSTINEFKRHSRARFYQDSFIDDIDFDYLEIQIIEE